MGININVRKKDEKLMCHHFRKSEFDENLEYESRINDIFRAKIVNNIVSEENGIGKGVLYDNSVLQIQTHDTIKNVKEGDIIKIVQLNKYFMITEIQEVVEETNLEYMTYSNSNKALVISLRGKGKNK